MGSLDLQVLIGRFVPTPVGEDIIDALLGAEIQTGDTGGGFQLTLAVSKNSTIMQRMLPFGELDPGVRVILIALVNNFPHVLMDGLITRQDLQPTGRAGESTLTLTGRDLTVAFDMVSEWQCFPALPPNVRVMTICAKPRYLRYGIVPAAVPPIQLDVPNPTERIPTAATTDLAYINALAADAGYVFFIDPGPLPGVNVAYWGPQVRIGVPQHTISIDWDGSTTVDELSFSYDGMSRSQLTVTVLEPITKIPLPIPIPDVSVFKPPLGLRPAVTLREEQLDAVAHLNPIQAALRGVAHQSQTIDAVTSTGKLDVLRYGSVLRSRDLVGVRGAGLAYDGVYYITGVTHSIKRGQFNQSFTLARDALVSNTPVVLP